MERVRNDYHVKGLVLIAQIGGIGNLKADVAGNLPLFGLLNHLGREVRRSNVSGGGGDVPGDKPRPGRKLQHLLPRHRCTDVRVHILVDMFLRLHRKRIDRGKGVPD